MPYRKVNSRQSDTDCAEHAGRLRAHGIRLVRGSSQARPLFASRICTAQNAACAGAAIARRFRHTKMTKSLWLSLRKLVAMTPTCSWPTDAEPVLRQVLMVTPGVHEFVKNITKKHLQRQRTLWLDTIVTVCAESYFETLRVSDAAGSPNSSNRFSIPIAALGSSRVQTLQAIEEEMVGRETGCSLRRRFSSQNEPLNRRKSCLRNAATGGEIARSDPRLCRRLCKGQFLMLSADQTKMIPRLTQTPALK